MGTERRNSQPVVPGARDGRSTGDLVRSIGSDTVTLVRKEIELAKQEVQEGVAARVKGIAAVATAGVMGLFLVGFLAAAGAAGLALVMPLWAALLIVAGVFVLLAGITAAAGIAMLKRPPLKPEKTKETIKEDVEWAKAQLRR